MDVSVLQALNAYQLIAIWEPTPANHHAMRLHLLAPMQTDVSALPTTSAAQ